MIEAYTFSKSFPSGGKNQADRRTTDRSIFNQFFEVVGGATGCLEERGEVVEVGQVEL